MARSGPVALAARRDLKALPDVYRKSVLAEVMLNLARDIDLGLPARDKAALAREMRLHYLTLHTLAPPKGEADTTDEMQAQREKRMRQAQG